MKQSTKKYIFVLLALVILFFLIVSWSLYTRTLRDNFQKEIISSLKEVSEQGRNIMEKEIEDRLELLTETSRRVGLYGMEDYPVIVYDLKDTCEENGFKRMGIITADGITCTTDDADFDLSDREYYKKGLEGEKGITGLLHDRKGNGGINVYSVPVYHENQITGVLFATCSTDDMREQLAVSSFGGQGYTYIVDREGNIVVDSLHINSYHDMENVFETIRMTSGENSDRVDKMKQNFEAGDEGCIKYRSKGFRYMYYCPLSVNGWYLLTVAPANVLDSKMNTVLKSTYLLGIFLFTLFGGLVYHFFRDQKRRKKELMDMICIDRITGGYTYEKFQVEARKLFGKSDRAPLAILNIDIDDFKFINELYGYEEGNHLIRYINSVLAQWCLEGELYGHLTADLFVALVWDQGEEILSKRLDELCSLLQSYPIKPQNRLQIVPSIGVFQIHDLSLSMEFCLDCAGIARKSRKGQFTSYYAFYDDEVKQQIYRDKQLEGEMLTALENGEFTAYYQPQYDAMTKQIVGAEALVRWIRPDGMVILPGQFIPLFEKNGFISKLDQFMFQSVCIRQKRWLDEGYQVVPVSVNVSRKLLYNGDLTEKYNEILRETGLPVQYVKLEITESVFFDNRPRLLEMIEKLHEAGYQILLDDFGTGYSSMEMLKDMAFDVLKVDKSFVDNIGDERGNKVVDGIIRLADSLGLETIAEGVETREQYEYLKYHGCGEIQGYYFGRPMEAGAFERLLEKKAEKDAETD